MNALKKVSIRDIAQASGVSTATVSLVLNGKDKNGRVSVDIADKVRKIADEMDYQPNRLAVGLKRGRSMMIGLLVVEISNPFFGMLASFIQGEMEALGYDVIIMNTDEKAEQMGKAIDIMSSRQVDGFLVVPTESGEKYVQKMLRGNKPLVLIDRYYPTLKTCNVLLDNVKAGFDLTDHLVKAGCKRIAMLAYDSQMPQMTERIEGYKKALEAAGLYDEDLLKTVRFNYMQEDIIGAICWLFQRKDVVDGIVFATNTIAGLAIRQLLYMDVDISKDVLLAGFDMKEISDYMNTFVPYISQPLEQMARTASQMLINRIEGKETEEDKTIYIEGPLITG